MRTHDRLFLSRICSIVAITIITTSTGQAQLPSATNPSGADSVFRRAQRLVAEGNGLAGRTIVDSVLALTPENTPAYADALYWRATLAETHDRARFDYLRVATEYATTSRAEDALLRLAQIANEAGDRVSAKKYLVRMTVEHTDGRLRAQGAYWTGRVLLADGATSPACAALAQAKATVSSTDIELVNQINYYLQPCTRATQQADAARSDSVVREDSAARSDPVARATTPAWSAQVAAYSTKEDAGRLAATLTSRGYTARVTADKPYRVRIGHFSTRAGAAALAERLRSAKMTVIIVRAETP